MMPIDLVLVRHGESEGNLAKKRSKDGDDSAAALFKGRHSSSFRLTDKGRTQAKKAGEWIRENVGGGVFGRYYTSAYLRARETAGLLDLPDARWYVEPALRERDWGELDVMSETERQQRFKETLQMKKVSPLYWIPPNGESIVHATERVYRILGTLARECSSQRVVIVVHAEIMWCFRLLLERMSEEHYNMLDASGDPKARLHNCQILHYTRMFGGVPQSCFKYVRSVCPWDMSLSRNEPELIARPKYSNADLLASVEKTPRLVND